MIWSEVYVGMWYVVCGMWYVVCDMGGMWYVGMWYVACGMLICDMWYVICWCWYVGMVIGIENVDFLLIFFVKVKNGQKNQQ
jgi:hypothetical protein